MKKQYNNPTLTTRQRVLVIKVSGHVFSDASKRSLGFIFRVIILAFVLMIKLKFKCVYIAMCVILNGESPGLLI